MRGSRRRGDDEKGDLGYGIFAQSRSVAKSLGVGGEVKFSTAFGSRKSESKVERDCLCGFAQYIMKMRILEHVPKAYREF